MLIMPMLAAPAKEISLTAWIILGIIIAFVFFLNLTLFTALRNKDNPDAQVLQRFIQSVRKPNQKENEMIGELHRRVEKLKSDDES